MMHNEYHFYKQAAHAITDVFIFFETDLIFIELALKKKAVL